MAGQIGTVGNISDIYIGNGSSNLKVANGWVGTASGNLQIYSSGIKLSDLPTGTIIQINENGTPHNFRIAQHNYIQNGVTAIERVLCLSDTVAFNANNVNTYGGGTLDTFLTGAYKNRLDSKVKNKLATVPIPTTPGDRSTTITSIPRDVFVLSGAELGLSDTFMPVEGTAFDLSINDYTRTKYGDDATTTARQHWTRTSHTGSNALVWVVNTSGEKFLYDVTSNSYLAPALSLSSSFTPSEYTLPLSQLSWYEISEISRSGRATEYFRIGDEKDITLTTGETLTLQIYGLSHDDLADESGKAGITFGLKNLMAETRQMETSDTNANSFVGSAMYQWLSGTVFNSLPSDLRSFILSVTKRTSAGNQSTTIRNDTMSIFLFSEVECFGRTTNSVAGEGSPYPIFTFYDNAGRIKKLSNGTGSDSVWWMRSPYATNSLSFCVVSSAGAADSYAAEFKRGVCFGFCV